MAMISRRTFVATAAVASPALAALRTARASIARPGEVRRIRITKVHTVEVRGVITGKGLVLPWDSTKTPRDTRDYVVTQFLTDQGLIGTTIDGDYNLRKGIGRVVRDWAEPYFVGTGSMKCLQSSAKSSMIISTLVPKNPGILQLRSLIRDGAKRPELSKRRFKK